MCGGACLLDKETNIGRRTVKKQTKIRIIVAFCLSVLLLLVYKIPYNKTYEATLDLYEEGASEVFGERLDVEIRVRVQRHFLTSATYKGTIVSDGVRYVCEEDMPGLSLFGILSDPDTFTLTCTEKRGEYLLTAAVAVVEDGEIRRVLLRDENGIYAGAYGTPPED